MAGTAMTATFLAVLAGASLLAVTARRLRPNDRLPSLEGWALADRSLGPLWTWMLLGGTIFTAYTFTAVPGLAYGNGAPAFFAVPYTVLVCPLVFVLLARLWTVARRHGYITVADFVRGRYGSAPLALVVALTGILATMPYLALQLLGIRAVLTAGGMYPAGATGDLVMVALFAGLAVATYRHGLRAPTVISALKAVAVFVSLTAVTWLVPGAARWSGCGLRGRRPAAGFSRAAPQPRSSARLRHPRPGLRSRPADVPACAHGGLRLRRFAHPAQDRRGVARVDRAAGALRVPGDRCARGGGAGAGGHGRGGRADAGGPADAGTAGRAGVRSDHRGGACPGCGDVDRGRDQLRPQCLCRVRPSDGHTQAAGAHSQVGVAHREGGRGGVRVRAARSGRHQPPVARRGLDPADLPGRGRGAVHPMAAPPGPSSPGGGWAWWPGRSSWCGKGSRPSCHSARMPDRWRYTSVSSRCCSI